MISVVVPVFNGEETVARAVDSALAQQVELEVIVINDCSTDRTAEILRRYATDRRVRLFDNLSNLGVAESRNRGVDAARGEYVAFLDADDWWEEGKLVEQMNLLACTGGVICSTARKLFCEGSGKNGQIIHVPAKVTYHGLLGHNSIACSSVVIRTDVAREFPMAHSEIHEDYLTWLKILKKYRICYGVDKPYLNYSLSTVGKSGSKLHSARMTFGVYRQAGLNLVMSCFCFVAYALHGVWNYYRP
ncbi:MAG TPA: glycosyl transferase family 2, partial [Lachnospiraceae bacterium]|nr:glycosyl transferase family 2 [Lachnospiraceae bacterium]